MSRQPQFRLGAACAVLLFCTASAQGVTLSAVQDADVAAGDGWDNAPLGDSTHISVNYSDATSVIAHIEFDVSSLSAGSVQSATLRLFHDFNTNNGASFDISRVTSAWDEDTVTYNTRPSVDAAIYSTLAIADSDTEVWREWDVTTLVQEWVDAANDNYGMAIVRNPDEEPWPYFRSKDYDVSVPENFPELVIELVPESSTMLLAGLGGLGLLLVRRRLGIAAG